MVEQGLIMNLLIFMALVISLSSCEPKDQAIKTTNGFVSSQGKDNSSSNYRYAALTLDRATESLHLIKTTLNSDYATKNGIILSDDAGKRVLSYGIENGAFKKKEIMTSDYKHLDSLNMLVEGAESLVEPIQALQLSNLDQSNVKETFFINRSGKVNDRSDVSIKNINRTIKLQKLSEENRYEIAETSTDEINIARTGQVISVSTFKMVIVWDGKVASLDQPIQVISLEQSSQRFGLPANYKFSSQLNLTISLNDNCPSINGEIKLSSPLSNQDLEMIIQDSSITYKPNQKPFVAVTCGIRPAVDLRKLSSYN